MAEVQKSEYSPFGCISIGPPDRPEPARPDPKLDTINFPAALRVLGLDAAGWDHAMRLVTPETARVGDWEPGGFLGRAKPGAQYSRKRLLAWRDAIIELADKLR